MGSNPTVSASTAERMTQDDRRDAALAYAVFTRACRAGDLADVKAALGWPQDFPNTPLPMDLGLGSWPLVAAISLSPLSFIGRLLDLGADPNFEALDGFPSLMSAIDTNRPDRVEIMALLLHHGARTDQRGINDWTPLHHAVAHRDLDAVRLLLAHGADAAARTRIDRYSTPIEDAAANGFAEVEALMRSTDHD